MTGLLLLGVVAFVAVGAMRGRGAALQPARGAQGAITTGAKGGATAPAATAPAGDGKKTQADVDRYLTEAQSWWNFGQDVYSTFKGGEQGSSGGT